MAITNPAKNLSGPTAPLLGCLGIKVRPLKIDPINRISAPKVHCSVAGFTHHCLKRFDVRLTWEEVERVVVVRAKARFNIVSHKRPILSTLGISVLGADAYFYIYSHPDDH